ncbi:hypothetical protein [Methylobacterium sp. AMS5]|uniref:hypothetical protein n=1 Tax=Methylobacterium sp. AMS5 TaxID=925818 RepID=UPI00074F9014|nr:hypothetical protein [Methylobacterium sp. AMS5]AMB48307.1 hypothetical protein Y590_25400 [Methylobacterium sp. AMS5]
MTIQHITSHSDASTIDYDHVVVTLIESNNGPVLTCDTAPDDADLPDTHYEYETDKHSHALIAASQGKTLFAYTDCGPDITAVLVFETAAEAVEQFRASMKIVFDCEEQMRDAACAEPTLRAQISEEAERIAAAFLAEPNNAVHVHSEFSPNKTAEQNSWMSMDSTAWGLTTVTIAASAPESSVVVEVVKDYRTNAA